MLKSDTMESIRNLGNEMVDKFSPPEYIPGCEVIEIGDKDEYDTNNGWIEAVVSKHNQQRCRWKGQFAIEVGDFVDVLYFRSYRLFVVMTQGGEGASKAQDGVLLADGSVVGATGAAQDFGANGTLTDTIAESTASAGVSISDPLHLEGDEASLKQRTIDMFQTSIDDHFDDDVFSGFSGWAAYTGFVTPGFISETATDSMVRIYNSTANGPAARAFAYLSPVSDVFWARCNVGLDCRTGIRMDDGTNDNYYELFFEYSGALMMLRHRYAISAAVTGPTNLWANPAPIMTGVLRIGKISTNVFGAYLIDTPAQLLAAQVGSMSWTAARVGLYHEHLSGTESSLRASLFDWYINA